jgi:low affinity Fe/Cu permease
MVQKMSALKALTDEELIASYDESAPNTFVGIDFYLGELARRRTEHSEQRIEALTERVKSLTVVITVLTAINCLAAIVAAATGILAIR